MDDLEVTTTDDSRVNEVYKLRQKSDSFLSTWRKQAKEWFDLVANKQWTDNEKADLEAKNRIPVQFNRIGAVINAICGSEVSNRQEVKYLPRTMGDVQTNDILNAAAQWARDESNAEDEESDAFRDLSICGYGWTETVMDYSETAEGKVQINRRNPLTMRYDPAARRRNLADGKWIQADIEDLTEEEIKARWGEAKFGEMVMNLNPPESKDGDHDASRAWEYINDQGGRKDKSGTYTVIHHCWYETKKMHRLADPTTGQMVELDATRLAAIKKIPGLKDLKAVKFDKRVYKHIFVCQGVNMEEGDAPCQCGFPYEVMTGYRHQTEGYFYGIVWPMSDPQKFANKFLSNLMHIFSSNAKGGLIYEDGAIPNPRQFEKDWAKADANVKVADGAISQNRIKEKTQPPYPQLAEGLLQFCVESLPMASGVNVELLGLADRQQAGVVEAQRTKAALTILATLFDALRLYRKRQGKTLAYYITEYLSDGRLIRITGNTGDMKYVPLMKDRDFAEYDVIVDEAVNSRDVKERTWVIFSQLLPMLKGMGITPPAAVLDYSPLPSGLVTEWKQQIDQQQKNPQPSPEQVAHQNELQKIQAQSQANIAEKQAESQIEGQRADNSGQIASIDAEKEIRIAEMRARYEQQTEIEKARIKAASDIEVERIKQQGAMMQLAHASQSPAVIEHA